MVTAVATPGHPAWLLREAQIAWAIDLLSLSRQAGRVNDSGIKRPKRGDAKKPKWQH